MRLMKEDRDRVHAALVAAQGKTRAHLVVTILPASDRYALYPLLWAAMAAFLVGAGFALLRPELSLRLGLVFEAASFLVAALILEPFASRLLVVPPAVKRDKASSLAHREFAARILATQQDGVLIFASLGERHVELLATRAVHVAVGEVAWEEIVARFTDAAGKGRPADAALAAIDACAKHLAQYFPA